MGFIGIGDVSSLGVTTGPARVTGGVAGASCLMVGTTIGCWGGGGSSGPSLADRFLLRGSVDVFDPASSASINSELSCSNAVVIAKSNKGVMLLYGSSKRSSQQILWVSCVKLFIFIVICSASIFIIIWS
jgi:hypothetical protein